MRMQSFPVTLVLETDGEQSPTQFSLMEAINMRQADIMWITEAWDNKPVMMVRIWGQKK